MNAIELDKVSKKYSPWYGQGRSPQRLLLRGIRRLWGNGSEKAETQELWALKDVDLAVEKGEALGVVGPNGAGKSTILKLLSHISKPTSGSLQVNGKVAALIEVGAGFHPEMTGRENVYLSGAIRGLSRSEIDRKFDQIMEFAELEGFTDVPVKRYSTGMYMRLGFAVAAHVDPDILLIDEVLAVGDLGFHWKCLERIKKLRKDKKTIVLVSHNLDAVRAVCDRAILLQHGVITCAGPTETVLTAYRDCMLGEQEYRLRLAILLDQGPQHKKRWEPEIEVGEVRLMDEGGSERTTFRTGENLVVQVELNAHKPVTDPVFAVQVYSSDGTLCYSPTTSLDQIPIGIVSGKVQFTLEMPNLNLLPNTYYVSVFVFESKSVMPYDMREKAAVFRIESPLQDLGLFYLPHRWRLPFKEDVSHTLISSTTKSDLERDRGSDVE